MLQDKELEEDFVIDEAEEGNALYEHLSMVVDKGQSAVRIDKFLSIKMENRSRSRIQAAADSGNILVNGKSVKSSYKIKPLDEISLVLPYPVRNTDIIPEDIPLDIMYEDDYLLIVNKKAGMVVHPGNGNSSGTLVNGLAYHLRSNEISSDGDLRAGLVHRIDKNTSGILVIAKDEYTHAALAKQFFHHTISRRYVAIVWGNLQNDSGTIEGNITRHAKDRLRMAVSADPNIGKRAVTHYTVLERFGYVTLVECRLETGRTHQIRVHMEHIGSPLFADEKYGGDRILKGTTFAKYRQFVENCFSIMPRQALHAKSLAFIHPITKKEVSFDSEIAPDMKAVISKWREYSKGNSLEE